jgi:hypothetical protein
MSINVHIDSEVTFTNDFSGEFGKFVTFEILGGKRGDFI